MQYWDLLKNVRNSEKPIYVRGLGGTHRDSSNICVMLAEVNPHTILSLGKAQAMGFKEITSNDQKGKVLNYPEKGSKL